MNLNFSTQINGKPTYFPQKIWCGLIDQKINEKEFKKHFPNYTTADLCHKSKRHTIRKDEANRWKAGVMIDFYTGLRTPEAFRFAPRIPVVSTQEIFMTRRGSMLEITIAKVGCEIGEDDFYLEAFQHGDLAQNDGFDNYDDFRNYFINAIEENGEKTGNYWFKGKIIHWTDLKY